MKKKPMDIVTKMTIIGIAGLVVITVVIIAMSLLNKSGKKPKTVDNKQQTEVTETNNTDGKDIEYGRAIAVVKKVDTSNSKLIVLDVETNNVITLAIDGAVDLKDEYGTLLTLIQLNMGDLVETKYDKNSLRPEYVHKTAKNWVRKSITGVTVDPETKTLSIGNDQYAYTSELISLFNGEVMDIGTLHPEDKVTLSGYQDKVWTVVMENGHGYITLKNHSYFIGGTLEIGISKMADIEETTSIVVPEGVHYVVATKDDLTHEAEVMVANGQEVVIDVSDASPRTGLVQFRVLQEGIQFSINGQVYSDFSEPISLEYGTYNIKVVKDQFVDFENELVVNKAFTEFEINLEKKPLFLHVNDPKGVEIYIDGNYLGQIPVSTPIEPGDYRITLRQDGFYSKTHTIKVLDDGQDDYIRLPDLMAIEQVDPAETSQPSQDNWNNNSDNPSGNNDTTDSPSTDGNEASGNQPEDKLEDTSGADKTPAVDTYGNNGE